MEGCDGVKMSRVQHGDPIFHRLPVRHLPRRLVARPGVADGGVQFRPLLGLVLGLEQVPGGNPGSALENKHWKS